jgi:hypothetical protein
MSIIAIPPILVPRPRFGSWWRLPRRGPLAWLMGNLCYDPATGHLVRHSDGHLLRDCTYVCPGWGSTPTTITATISGVTLYSGCMNCSGPISGRVAGTINGTYTMSRPYPASSPCEYQADIGGLLFERFFGSFSCPGTGTTSPAAIWFKYPGHLAVYSSTVADYFYAILPTWNGSDTITISNAYSAASCSALPLPGFAMGSGGSITLNPD